MPALARTASNDAVNCPARSRTRNRKSAARWTGQIQAVLRATHLGQPAIVTAADTDSATARLGIPREKRALSPHLTLARIKPPMELQPLHQAIAALPSLEFGGFEAGSFFLYHSTLRPAGSVYTKLAEFPLTKS